MWMRNKSGSENLEGTKRAACEEFEAKLEDYLSGALAGAEAAEVKAHLAACTACPEALGSAQVSAELLRGTLEAASEPSGAFVTRVLAQIRDEAARETRFWRPLEVLASRLALTAAVLLIVLTAYMVRYSESPLLARQTPQAVVSDSFPELGGQPPQDEILPLLAGSNNGR